MHALGVYVVVHAITHLVIRETIFYKCFTVEYMADQISKEFIIGLLTRHGSFSFSTRTKYNRKRKRTVHKIPTFTLEMSIENKDLMIEVQNKLKIKNKLYKFYNQRSDGLGRKDSIKLIIRELKNIE